MLKFVQQTLTANGTSSGILTVSTTNDFVEGAIVFLNATGLSSVKLIIDQIIDPIHLAVKTTEGYTYTRFNAVAYTTGLSAYITQPGQDSSVNTNTLIGNSIQLVAVATAGTPTYSEGDKVPLRVDLNGVLSSSGGGGGGGGGGVAQLQVRNSIGAWADVGYAGGNLNVPIAIQAALPTGTNSIGAVTQSGSWTVAATESGTWTVQPGNTANTTPWLATINQGGNSATVSAGGALKVDGSAVTQPVSGTFFQATQPVSIAGTVAVSGPLTDTQLRASAVPVSGTVTANIGTTGGLALEHITAASPNSVRLSDGAAFYNAPASSQLPAALVGARLDINNGAWLGSTAPTVGQKTSTNSIPIVIASDQSAISVSQSGSWTVAGTGNFSVIGTGADNTANSAAKLPVIGAVATTVAPTFTDGNMVPLSVDTAGALRVSGSISASNPSVSATGSAPPASATLAGGSVTTAAPTYTTGQMSALSLTTAGGLRVDGSAVTQPVSGTFFQATQPVSGTVAATQSGTWTVQPGNTANTTPWLATINQGGNSATVSAGGALKVDGSAVTQPVSGTFFQATQPVSGTVTANIGTSGSLALDATLTGGTARTKVTDGTNNAAVKAASTAAVATDPALVVAVSPNNKVAVTLAAADSPFAFSNDQRMTVGQETVLFYDPVDGASVNTSIWSQSQSGMTQAQATGVLTLNSGSSTTTTNYSILQSIKRFQNLSEFPLYVQFRARFIFPAANAVMEMGFITAATNAAPTDGVFFRLDATGVLKGVINHNGTETTTAAFTAVNSANYYNWEIFIYEDHVEFDIEAADGSIITNTSLNIPVTQGSPTSTSRLSAMARVYNSGTPASAPQILISNINVQRMDNVMHKPWAEQLATYAQGGMVDPTTFAQIANYANSTAPANATLSNTAAGYTTLGGLFEFAAVAGAETDYALFAYQIPAGFQFYTTGIRIEAFTTGAATSGLTVLQWGFAINSSAVSLATAGVSPPIRMPLGIMTLDKSAPIGSRFDGMVDRFPRTSWVVESGKFLHVILRIPVGTATASLIIRGTVYVNGYFE